MGENEMRVNATVQNLNWTNCNLKGQNSAVVAYNCQRVATIHTRQHLLSIFVDDNASIDRCYLQLESLLGSNVVVLCHEAYTIVCVLDMGLLLTQHEQTENVALMGNLVQSVANKFTIIDETPWILAFAQCTLSPPDDWRRHGVWHDRAQQRAIGSVHRGWLLRVLFFSKKLAPPHCLPN